MDGKRSSPWSFSFSRPRCREVTSFFLPCSCSGPHLACLRWWIGSSSTADVASAPTPLTPRTMTDGAAAFDGVVEGNIEAVTELHTPRTTMNRRRWTDAAALAANYGAPRRCEAARDRLRAGNDARRESDRFWPRGTVVEDQLGELLLLLSLVVGYSSFTAPLNGFFVLRFRDSEPLSPAGVCFKIPRNSDARRRISARATARIRARGCRGG